MGTINTFVLYISLRLFAMGSCVSSRLPTTVAEVEKQLRDPYLGRTKSLSLTHLEAARRIKHGEKMRVVFERKLLLSHSTKETAKLQRLLKKTKAMLLQLKLAKLLETPQETEYDPSESDQESCELNAEYEWT